ncbi:hypothetical protein ANN_01308 [Periplaneta americana]|uniref:Uncharacterized protein n=1 Tax=Periplaneta americana TaxID=6978 RepID=A0ABQ8TV08_PERAM|nr:hypothetical protein ANN_01308 [Periplaneta americana]
MKGNIYKPPLANDPQELRGSIRAIVCRKILLRILNRRLYSKMEEEQYGSWKGKDARNAIGLLQTIGERVDWNEVLGILKKCGVDWKERRLFSNLYMKQQVKGRIGEEMPEGSKTGKEYVKDALYHLSSSDSGSQASLLKRGLPAATNASRPISALKIKDIHNLLARSGLNFREDPRLTFYKELLSTPAARKDHDELNEYCNCVDLERPIEHV